jgi:hypothetical protein
VWIGAATYTPPLDAVARETIVWSSEAEQKITRVPETVRNMVRMVILRYAQEQGHTVITSVLVDEATARFCPGRSPDRADQTPRWTDEANSMLAAIDDATAADIRLRAEKHARRAGATEIAPAHVQLFLASKADQRAAWNAAALARINRVPEMGRAAVRDRAEARARDTGAAEVSLDIVEAALTESRQVMEQAMRAGGHKMWPRPSE